MATIVERKDRPKPFPVQIHRKGHRACSKAFTLKPDAERWARKQERSIELHGLPATFKEYQRTGHAVSRES